MTPPAHPDSGLSHLNALTTPELKGELLACLAVPRWAGEIAAGAPYADAAELRAAADAAARTLTSEEVDAALASHPRIGERPAGPDAAASRSEQSGIDHRDEQLARALAEGNAAYEQRFGHLFLICAAGLGGAKILERLRARLSNDAETERGVVADELRKIALLRLDRILHT